MPNGEASLQFVTVGNPGNVADYTGFGLVGAYTYQMGQYDVTVGQYCQFLNAVAATDTYGLYNSYMATVSSGTPWATQSMPTVGIVRSGSFGQLHVFRFVQLGHVEQLCELQFKPLSLRPGRGGRLSDLQRVMGRFRAFLQPGGKRPADQSWRGCRARREEGRTHSTGRHRCLP